MEIQKVNFANVNAKPNTNFKGSQRVYYHYENPVSRSTERNLAVLSSVGISALIGGIIGGLSTCFIKSPSKVPILVGLGAGILSLLFTLPQKVYSSQVNSFARQKEMDVFARQKAAQTSIYGDINEEVQDEDVPLDTKINHYAHVRMADNGNGVIVRGV